MLHRAPDDIQPCRARELREFVQRVFDCKATVRALQLNADEVRALGGWCGWDSELFWNGGLLGKITTDGTGFNRQITPARFVRSIRCYPL